MMEEEVGLMSRYLRSVFTDQDGVYVDVWWSVCIWTGTQQPAQIVARSSLVTINWGQHSDLDPITGYKYVTLPHNIHAISNIQFLSSVVESIEFVYEYKCKEICR